MSHRSYTSSSTATASTWTESLNLWKGVRRASRNMRVEVESLIGEVRRVEAKLSELYGFKAKDSKVLEIGVGQLPRQVAYFALHNEVIGIDLDVIPQGLNVNQYLKLGRTNGMKRLAKTIARKLLGMDRQFNSTLKSILGVASLPSAKLMQMDASKMSFADDSFDLIYSFNVFEHLPEPGIVLEEMKRVLRPGGCIVSHFHLYTSDSGCHDVRILSGDRQGLPFWPHLRPQYQSLVMNAAYINKLRVADWQPIFNRHLPGQHLECWQDPNIGELQNELHRLREQNEVREFTDEELMSKIVVSYWQKPLT